MKLDTQVIIDGSKNGAVMIVGEVESGDDDPRVTGLDYWTVIVDPKAMSPAPAHFSIGHLEFSVVNGLELLLAWHSTSNERKVILPLSGRGRMDFTSYGGLKNNVADETRSGGLEVCALSGSGFFTLIFDLIKK
jgi:hypothetical protein